MYYPGNQTQSTGLSVTSLVIHLDPGWFSLSILPGPPDRGTGLPGVRVSLPPGPAGRREAVIISAARGDGWMTAADDPILMRVAPGGAEILVTQYWSAADTGAIPPQLKLERLTPEGSSGIAPGGPGRVASGLQASGPQASGPQASGPPAFGPIANPLGGLAAPRTAEIVAHLEGVGDVDGKLGDWVGVRGSGRAIEGFGLTPRQGFSSEDFDIRAVLGRDWLSPWLPGGSFCGSRGLALPLRGFSLRLRPAAAAKVDLACLARFVDGSEIGPVSSDRVCVSPSLAALEAFQIIPRPRLG